MGSYTLTASAGGVANVMLRKNEKGDLYQTESERSDYTAPPEGEYELEITAFAEPFEMPKAEEYGGGMQTKTRLEFTVLSGKGKGKKFAPMYTWTVGAKSTLGQLIAKLRGAPVAPGEDFDIADLIGTKFKAYVNHAINKKSGQKSLDNTGKPYPEITIPTIKLLSADAAKAGEDDDWPE